MKSSQRMEAVQAPIIPLIGALSRENPGTISFGQGVAYYGPPPEAFTKVQNHINDESINRYGPVEGIPELQQALIKKLETQNNVVINDNNIIVVTAGSNMAFNTAILAITDPSDEVILPIPYYFNHEMSLAMERCKAVLVATGKDFHLYIDKLEAAITERTKAIVTISPNNPSGAVYTKTELDAVNLLCKKHNIYHISDEAYEDFYYDKNLHYSVASNKENTEHTISLYSFSKGYGFAGWRIGYMVIPIHLFDAVKKIQDTILISPPIISQYAAIGALETGQNFLQEKRAKLQKKRNLVLNMLEKLNCLKQKPVSEGAFYTLLNIDKALNDIQLAKALIKKHKVATIPGSAFGISTGCYLRISYGALSDQDIEIGMENLINGLAGC